MKIQTIIFLFFLPILSLQAQYDANWPTDSLILKFDYQGLVSMTPAYTSRANTESSISDVHGNLICYVANDFNSATGFVYDINNQVITNGNNLKYSRILNSTVFLPYTGTPYTGLITLQLDAPTYHTYAWYHKINLQSLTVEEKNTRFSPEGEKMKMGVAPVRHANGRDWWVIMHNIFGRNYYVFFCSPDSFRLDSIYYTGAYVGLDQALTGKGWGGGISPSLRP